jgi:hypothetical protein
LLEVNEASEIVGEAADQEANIIFGAVIDENLKEDLRVTVIATGFDQRTNMIKRPKALQESLGKTDRDNLFPDNVDIPVFYSIIGNKTTCVASTLLRVQMFASLYGIAACAQNRDDRMLQDWLGMPSSGIPFVCQKRRRTNRMYLWFAKKSA